MSFALSRAFKSMLHFWQLAHCESQRSVKMSVAYAWRLVDGQGQVGRGVGLPARQHRAINMSTFVCAEFSLLLPQMEARELLQFMQFFQYTYTHTHSWLHMYTSVCLQMYVYMYIHMCVCIYVPCDWGNIFLNSWPNFCFTL